MLRMPRKVAAADSLANSLAQPPTLGCIVRALCVTQHDLCQTFIAKFAVRSACATQHITRVPESSLHKAVARKAKLCVRADDGQSRQYSWPRMAFGCSGASRPAAIAVRGSTVGTVHQFAVT